MSEDKYFVIMFSEDGDVYIDELNREDLLEAINIDSYGDFSDIDSFTGVHLGSFCGSVIIKGKIVKPVSKKVVEILDIE